MEQQKKYGKFFILCLNFKETMLKQYNVLSIILAAGAGTRMKSELPKVLHILGGYPIITYPINLLNNIGIKKKVVVIAPKMQNVVKTLNANNITNIAIQKKTLGTANAVLSAHSYFKSWKGTILVLFGDNPFIKPETIIEVVKKSNENNHSIVLLGIHSKEKNEYGKIIKDQNGKVKKIIEYKNANKEHFNLTLCNTGIMAIPGKYAVSLLNEIPSDKISGEFYLTDIIKVAAKKNIDVDLIESYDENELIGINSLHDLAKAENILQKTLRKKALDNGVTLTDPNSVFFSADTKLIGQDITIAPNVVFGPGVTIDSNVDILPFCKIEGAFISKGAKIGPFAHIRPKSSIGEGSKIGNFVEIKKSNINENSKINHLSYIGDAKIGKNVNIGAGTITCNYNGLKKNLTKIDDNVFIGSNSSLIAPINIGKGAIVGASSAITKDVSSNAIAIERSEQKEIKKGALKYWKKIKEKGN